MSGLVSEPQRLNSSQMLRDWLNERAHAALARRRAAYEELKTASQIADYQERVRDFFRRQLGDLGHAGPLDAQVVGTVVRTGHRVEKVIFESLPGHHVTASMYVPDGAGPFPAVLVPCGHADDGKACEAYQRACILLATNGLAALCYDPISQGERYQALEDGGTPKYGCTREHSIIGIGSMLLGTNTARYRIHDGMRAIDYLLSRGDVDGTRIGCTGNSGGGTMTSYLMALDPRIACAVPSCFLTTLDKLLETRGPQDAEQNISGDIAFGMDHADYIIMRAPKPTLMCVATRDFFDIEGAWDTFRQAKRIYARLGHSERVGLAETDAEHGFTTELRVAMVRWMRRWLLGIDDAIVEPDAELLTAEQLQCTPRGQVMLGHGERSVFDLNAEEGQRMRDARRATWNSMTGLERREAVRNLLGMKPTRSISACQTVDLGSVARGGCQVRRMLVSPEEGIWLEALAFEPGSPTGEVYLYVHGEGKEADAGLGGAIEQLAEAGHRVIALDLRGLGEEDEVRLPKNALLAYRLGRSLLGMRAEDILSCARMLANTGQTGVPRALHLVGVGFGGQAVLHAAFLEPERFSSLVLRRALDSWDSVVRAGDVPMSQMVSAVHGALRVYDLPDLVDEIAEMVTIEDPVDALGALVP